MNIDGILADLNRHHVLYVLIGGANFLLQHAPVLTYDVDIWIRDGAANRERCAAALRDMDATWGANDAEWGPVSERTGDWLAAHPLFCMNTRHGPLDIFRFVDGLTDWDTSRNRATTAETQAGTPYISLCDEDMLLCQLALPESQQKLDRIRMLQQSKGRRSDRA